MEEIRTTDDTIDTQANKTTSPKNQVSLFKSLLIVITVCSLSIVGILVFQLTSSGKQQAELAKTQEQLSIYEAELADNKEQLLALEKKLAELTMKKQANAVSLTKEYQAWVDAQTAVEPYDLFDDLSHAYQQFYELYADGYEGTEKYKAALDLLVPSKNQNDVDGYLWKLKRYFSTTQSSAIDAFIDDLVSVNLLKDDGDNYYSWSRSYLTKNNVVSKLNLTPDAAEALLGLLRSMDWNV